MWRFVIFLAIGLASSDKLDRKYLPPPGSKFAGGRPSDLDVPLEFPKESYITDQIYPGSFSLESSSGETPKEITSFDRSFDRKTPVEQNSQSLGPFTTKGRELTPEDIQYTLGINRGVGLQEDTLQSQNLPSPAQPSINQYLPNSFTLPTTTTSYAFTQTTTFSPIEGFDATANPISSTVASTLADNLSDIFNQNAISANPQNTFDTSSIPNQFVQGIGQKVNAISQQHNGHKFPYFQPNIPIPSQFNQNFNSHSVNAYLPGNQNQYLPTTTVSPISSITDASQSEFENQGFRQHLGVQPPTSTFDQTSYKDTFPRIPQANHALVNQDNILNNNLSSFINNIQGHHNQIHQTSPQFSDDHIFKGFVSPGETIAQNENVFQNPLQQSFDQNNYRQEDNTFVPSTSSPKDFSEYHPDSGISQLNSEQKPIYTEVNIPTITTPTLHYLGSSTSDIIRPESNVFQTTKAQQDFVTTSAPDLNVRFHGFSNQTVTKNIPVNAVSIAPDHFDTSKNIFEGSARSKRPHAESDRKAEVLSYANVLTPEGYSYSYDTSNGIHADESAITVDGTKASGSYSYTGDDGKVYRVVYTADENGFLPHGDHLPTPPPIPKEIQQVIEQAERDREAGIIHDGFYDEEKYGYKKYEKPTYTKKLENNFNNINENFKNIEEELEIGDPINHSNKNYLNQRKRPMNRISEDDTDYTQFTPNSNEDDSYFKTKNLNENPVDNFNDDKFENYNDRYEIKKKSESEIGRPKSSSQPFVSSTEKYLPTTLSDDDSSLYRDDNSFSYKQTTFRPEEIKPDISKFGVEQRINYDSIKPNTRRIEISCHRIQNGDNENVPSKGIEEKHTFPKDFKMHSKQSFNVKPPLNEDNDDDNGYQYAPPQTRFDYNNHQFPARLSDIANSRNQNKDTGHKSTIRLFMTPNVSRNYGSDKNNDESNDEDSDDFIENNSDSNTMTHDDYSGMKNNLATGGPLDKQSKLFSRGHYKQNIDNKPEKIPSNGYYAKNTDESTDGITKPQTYSERRLKPYHPGTKNNIHTYSTAPLPATEYTNLFDYEDSETKENPANKIDTGYVTRKPISDNQIGRQNYNKSTISPGFTMDDKYDYSTDHDRNTSLEPTGITPGFVQSKTTQTIRPSTIRVTSSKEEERPTTGFVSVKANSLYPYKLNDEMVPSTTYKPKLSYEENLSGNNQVYEEKSTIKPSQFNDNENYSPDYKTNVDKSVHIRNKPKYENTTSQRPFDDQGSNNEAPLFRKPQGSVIQKPYSYTTERVFGENFNGPKQAQKFDPKYGYYY